MQKVLSRHARYHQGHYVCRHPEKYVGNHNAIIYRSSLEKKFQLYCDLNPDIIYWNSEEIVIPYYDIVDGKNHRYYVDFWIVKVDENGKENKYIVEIKPYSKLKRPKLNEDRLDTRYIKSYNLALEEYAKNIQKWKAAVEYAKARNMKFLIITEKDLKKLNII